MAQLPIDEAINRFKENEDRFEKFVNNDEGYSTSGGVAVESVPAFLQRIEGEIEETTGTVAENLAASQIAKSQAEAARDAATVAGKVYASTVAGLAATTNGQYFSVPATPDAEFVILYLKSSGVAQEIKRYPSAAALSIIKQYDELTIFSIADEQNNIAFAVWNDGSIETNLISLKGKINVDSNGSIKTDSFSIVEENGYKFAIADELGNLILAIDSEGRLVANFGLVPTSSAAYNGSRTYDYEVNQVFTNGQSLSVGQAYPAISTVQPYDNLMFVKGMRPIYDYPGLPSSELYASLVPAIEENNASGWIGTLGETPSMGTGNMIKERILIEDGLSTSDVNYQILLSCPGYGATTIAQLSKSAGTGHYERMIEQTTYGKSLANAAGKTHAVQAVTWTQGESDYLSGTSRATYITKLNQLVVDFNADMKAITGQTKSIPMISYQVATHKTGDSTVPSIALAQLDAETSNALIYIATPMYHLPYNDGFHLTNVGSKWLGAYYGLAYKRIVIDGFDWKPLKPISAIRQAKIATIRFNVPRGRLVFDTNLVNFNTNYGFELVDSSDNPLTISSVAITGPDTVKIIASADIPAGAKVRYAWTGTGNYGPINGPRGNLRDTQGSEITFDPNGINKPMHNWCVIFEKEL